MKEKLIYFLTCVFMTSLIAAQGTRLLRDPDISIHISHSLMGAISGLPINQVVWQSVLQAHQQLNTNPTFLLMENGLLFHLTVLVDQMPISYL